MSSLLPLRIVVTGTSSGIGRALAERLLSRGHRVWGLARSDQREFALPFNGQFVPLRCDVGAWREVNATFASIAETTPHLDALVTCAGVQGEIGRTAEADPSKWTATVQANLAGTFHAYRAAHALLARSPNRAKIACFSGGGATKARPNFSAYASAKAAIVRFVETIAEEEGAKLDINAVAPGGVNTRLTDEVIAVGVEKAGASEHASALKQKTAGGVPPDRALDLVEWLISRESDGVSGRLLSAVWDPWSKLPAHRDALAKSDIYQLRRVTPADRGQSWD